VLQDKKRSIADNEAISKRQAILKKMSRVEKTKAGMPFNVEGCLRNLPSGFNEGGPLGWVGPQNDSLTFWSNEGSNQVWAKEREGMTERQDVGRSREHRARKVLPAHVVGKGFRSMSQQRWERLDQTQ